MVVCDKCRTQVEESRSEFTCNTIIASGKNPRDFHAIANTRAVLCGKCIDDLTEMMFGAFLNFFGGREKIDISIMDASDTGNCDVEFGNKLREAKPILAGILTDTPE